MMFLSPPPILAPLADWLAWQKNLAQLAQDYPDDMTVRAEFDNTANIIVWHQSNSD